jgi:hypothetical protein
MAVVPLAAALASRLAALVANPEVRSLVVKACANFEAALRQRSTNTTPARHIRPSYTICPMGTYMGITGCATHLGKPQTLQT